MHISYISMLALKFNIPKPPECWVLYRFVPKAPAPASPTSKRRAYPSPGKAVWVDEFPRIPFGGRCENSLEFTIDGSEIPPFTSWYGKYPIIDRALAPSQEEMISLTETLRALQGHDHHKQVQKIPQVLPDSSRCQICQSQSCVCCLQKCCFGDAIDKLFRSNCTWRIIPVSK